MSTAAPEAPTAPGRPDTRPSIDVDQLPDLDATVPCQIDLFLPERQPANLEACPCPATHLLTVSHGCTFTICDRHAVALTNSRIQRRAVCALLTGCPDCGRCGEPMCAGGERIEPLP